MWLRRTEQGFSLAEVMIVLVIVAVLLAIALPQYREYGERSRRSDAIESLLKLSLAQKKWRTNHTEFAGIDDIWSGYLSLQGHYRMGVETLPPDQPATTHFLVTATPRPGGQQEDDKCGTFAMNQDGAVYSGYAGKDCWHR